MADPPGLTGVDGSVALVRHGESTWIVEGRFQGQSDPPLSPAGLAQADLVAQRLRDRAAPPPVPLPRGAPTGVWHSPLSRAAMTAGAIGAALGGQVPLHAAPGLSELAQGAWEGLTHAEVQAAYGTELESWRRDPTRHHAPGGESLAKGAARVRSALQEVVGSLASTMPSGASDPVLGYGRAGSSQRPWAVVVAHDGVLRLVLLTLLGIPLERYWSFPFALAGLTVLELRDGVARLRAHNLVDHLTTSADGGPSPLGIASTPEPHVPDDRGGAL